MVVDHVSAAVPAEVHVPVCTPTLTLDGLPSAVADDNCSRVAAIPFVPAHRRSVNRQMRLWIRRHRAFAGAAHSLNVQQPMSAEFINGLKCPISIYSLTIKDISNLGPSNFLRKCVFKTKRSYLWQNLLSYKVFQAIVFASE